MKSLTNPFRTKMASGDVQHGLWLGLPDNSAAEIAASAGFDWLLIDSEHAPFDLRSILAHLQAIAPYDVAPIVRPVTGDTALLKDNGRWGLIGYPEGSGWALMRFLTR
ncbi:MAG TPA: hypothetical protein DD979_13295, partial [Gammaproteobacteria bacterium]|nr:hypothetical protein [Gammaproteobacteria bacterium]